MTEEILVNVTTFVFPRTPKEWRKTLSSNLYIEEVVRLCAEDLSISAHSFPFFGLRAELSNGEQYWLAPNRTLDSEKEAITRGKLFFRFRFKPARSLPRIGFNRRDSRGRHFGFRALLQQSLVLNDQLWQILLGQCETDLEKETSQFLLSKHEARGDLWALMLLGRSEVTLRKPTWKTRDIVAGLPHSLAQHKRFVRDVKSCIGDATQKFGDKDLLDVWITFLEEYVYESISRLIDKYTAIYENGSQYKGVVFIDTQECTCYPVVKFCVSNVAQDICSLKDIDSYSISENTLRILLRRQGQVCTFKFSSPKQVLSFASEMDAQFRTSIDWYANLCSDEPQSVYSPRTRTLKRNFVLPPAGLSSNLPGIKMSDDIPSSILNLRPFVLQQSSKTVGCLKVTFAKHVPDQASMVETWQLRFVNKETLWTINDSSGSNSFSETNLPKAEFDSLESACQALMRELRFRGLTGVDNKDDNDAIMVRLAHIGRSPRIHFIDPELVEDVKMEGNFQGLPVLAMSSTNCHNRVIKLVNIADGDHSRMHFAAWNGMQFLLREYSGPRNHILSRFWQAAELSTLWFHYGIAPVVAFSPGSDFYLLEFANNGPLDVYLTHNGGCNSAVYFHHLLLGMKTLFEAVAYLSSRNFVHGDVCLANVILLSHTVEPPFSFTVKLIPPEVTTSQSTRANDVMLPHRFVFIPQNGAAKSDVYSLGVTIIQLLRLGFVPVADDIVALTQNEPKLANFLEKFHHSAEEYKQPVTRLFTVVKNCLVFNDKSSLLTASSFLSQCAVELDKILAVVRNLPLVTLNATSWNSGIETELNKYFHIPYQEILPSENYDLNSSNEAEQKFLYLNRGHFGEVLLGFWRKPGPGGSIQLTKVALKRLLHDLPDSDQVALDRLNQEFHIWSNLRHPNIVQAFGLTWLNERPCIVMEYIDGSTLEKHSQLKKTRDLAFFREITSLLVQVTSGMRYLSERASPIVHCDLAARNVLISSESGDLIAKIADFGLACKVRPEDIYHRLPPDQKMPTAWCAPEVLSDSHCATPRSDVFSFGVLSWEALCPTTKRPAPGDSLAFRTDVPKKLVDIFLKCQKKLPEERPTFQMLETFLKELLENNEIL